MCVLLVEDDALIRETVADYFRDRGTYVLCAETGDVALNIIDNPPRAVSVLLTDFHMPGSHHGGDVAAYVSRHHRHIRIFIMTGRPDVLADACAPDIPYEAIHKPFKLDDLHTLISPHVVP